MNKEHFGGSCKFPCTPGRPLADRFASLRRAFLTGSQWFRHVHAMPLLIGFSHFVSEAFSSHLELKQMDKFFKNQGFVRETYQGKRNFFFNLHRQFASWLLSEQHSEVEFLVGCHCGSPARFSHF